MASALRTAARVLGVGACLAMGMAIGKDSATEDFQSAALKAEDTAPVASNAGLAVLKQAVTETDAISKDAVIGIILAAGSIISHIVDEERKHHAQQAKQPKTAAPSA